MSLWCNRIPVLPLCGPALKLMMLAILSPTFVFSVFDAPVSSSA